MKKGMLEFQILVFVFLSHIPGISLIQKLGRQDIWLQRYYLSNRILSLWIFIVWELFYMKCYTYAALTNQSFSKMCPILAKTYCSRFVFILKNVKCQLLNPDQSLRIKIPDIKAHSFFKDINWENLAAQNITAPYIPDVSKANCSNTFSLEDQMAEEKFESISSEQQKLFAAFDFNNIIVSSDKILK